MWKWSWEAKKGSWAETSWGKRLQKGHTQNRVENRQSDEIIQRIQRTWHSQHFLPPGSQTNRQNTQTVKKKDSRRTLNNKWREQPWPVPIMTIIFTQMCQHLLLSHPSLHQYHPTSRNYYGQHTPAPQSSQDSDTGSPDPNGPINHPITPSRSPTPQMLSPIPMTAISPIPIPIRHTTLQSDHQ